MNSNNLSSEIQLEKSLIRAPYESLNKSFRVSQKLLEKDLSVILNSINDLNKKKSTISKADANTTIDKLLNKAQSLKRKLEEIKVEEENDIKRLRIRIEHFKKVLTQQDDKFQVEQFNEIRVNRIVVDYLLREGYYDSAILLSKQERIQDFVDIGIFLSGKKVVDGLLKQDCTEGLSWCNENKSKLKKIKSNLEFNLRIQEFIELVRANRLLDAISYSRTHLSPNSQTNMKEIQQAMATLVFQKDTTCDKYKSLFDHQRWLDLISQFKNDNFVLHNLTTHSLLDIAMQSGLSALKTETCSEHDDYNINCPLCNEQFHTLAEPLPVSLKSHSSLVCRITGEIMNEDNYPMVLPNGNVYSKNALTEMKEKTNKITDPRTQEEFKFEDLRRAYIS
ncbi:lissencephaly type-1-like protein [Tieghemostelium lacteum]|uniref:Lissencephaly type-1-like protein n=1 Tax=Tieghemostelium lacteum TaxID=361077 RepID=A0A151Z7T7_TIELA|nr:lissencephaly type-1-like protein [Tieghemostelium lacteum]|eukprot:KYQ90022.1 lissencephaly type-1-like protein [Tieghemostelium lacteum]